ncbi:UNVERIFIED_CONTAM: hypothetical protein Sindi_1312700 [Sesamum indicum]
MSLGHDAKTCPTMKKSAQSMKVFIQRPPVERRVEDEMEVEKDPPTTDEPHTHGGEGGWRQGGSGTASPDMEADDDVSSVPTTEGPNKCIPSDGLNNHDHQIEVKELIRNNRLLLLGIPETRVAATNVHRIQKSICPDWKWLTDYANIGNRIWLTWNNSDVGDDVITVSDQLIHCRITNKMVITQRLLTIVYGNRRTLWRDLCELSRGIIDKGWFVMGDFNAVLDMSEVCGASGDITYAIDEFLACVMEAGLITLPMQGQTLTWHNCSRDARSP